MDAHSESCSAPSILMPTAYRAEMVRSRVRSKLVCRASLSQLKREHSCSAWMIRPLVSMTTEEISASMSHLGCDAIHNRRTIHVRLGKYRRLVLTLRPL